MSTKLEFMKQLELNQKNWTTESNENVELKETFNQVKQNHEDIQQQILLAIDQLIDGKI